MYGAELTDFLRALASAAERSEVPYSLIDASLGAYLATFAQRTEGLSEPHVSFSELTTRLVLLSDVLARDPSLSLEVHYIVAMCFEQAGFIGTAGRSPSKIPPFDDDDFLRLVLATLHYLTGEYRAQATASIARLSLLAGQSQAHNEVVRLLRRLLDHESDEQGSIPIALGGTDSIRAHVNRLSELVIRRRGGIFEQLGAGSPVWLAERGVLNESAIPIWSAFIANVQASGVSSLTHEQYSTGDWISTKKDVLVNFPTGSGKTVIGYVRAALCIAARTSALWILPTRALVRQVLWGLRSMFRNMDVQIQEVPTTEDPGALFSDAWEFGRPVIAATTPERALALLRSNPTALESMGVVILDEAQILCDGDRGVVAEQLVGDLKARVSNVRFVMMTGFSEAIPVLRAMARALELDVVELASTMRPSRRIYGILRSTGLRLEAAVYPPRPSAASPESAPAFVVRYPDRLRRNRRSSSDTARLFVARTHKAGLRSVVFVRTKESTESQAGQIRSRGVYQLPDDVRLRLRLELGRESAIEDAVRQGAAPHHGGLTALEQHVVERLVALGKVNTVFATPTLAQGVNLPLDLSIVTFTDRRDPEANTSHDLSESEVQNMLGRAGRAGFVPDGFCVLVRKESQRLRAELLTDEHRWFFSQRQPAAAGVVALLRRVESIGVASDWLDTLENVDFGEAQSIIAMLAASITAGDDMSDLQRFPSVRALATAERESLLAVADLIARRLRETRERNEDAFQIVTRTGLPPSYVEHILARVLAQSGVVDDTNWWDDEIRSFLTQNAAAPWVANLCGDVPPERLVDFAQLWRQGVPRFQLEDRWPRLTRSSLVRINTGSYLNQRMSLIAQLWGVAVPVAEVFNVDAGNVRQFAACVREGVPTTGALIWLRALGQLDRVLATMLDQQLALADAPYFRRLLGAEAALQTMLASPPSDADPVILAALRAALGVEHY